MARSRGCSCRPNPPALTPSGSGKPLVVTNAERGEEPLCREHCGGAARQNRDHARDEVGRAAVVDEFRSRLRGHGAVDDVVRPALRLQHRHQVVTATGRVGVARLSPREPGLHRQQVLDRHRPLARIRVLGNEVARGGEAQHRRFHGDVGRGLLLQRDREQHRRHRLRRRLQLVQAPGCVRLAELARGEPPERRIEHDAAVADDGNAVDREFRPADLGEHRVEAFAVDPLRRRRGGAPAGRRPVRGSRRLGREHAARVAGERARHTPHKHDGRSDYDQSQKQQHTACHGNSLHAEGSPGSEQPASGSPLIRGLIHLLPS